MTRASGWRPAGAVSRQDSPCCWARRARRCAACHRRGDPAAGASARDRRSPLLAGRRLRAACGGERESCDGSWEQRDPCVRTVLRPSASAEYRDASETEMTLVTCRNADSHPEPPPDGGGCAGRPALRCGGRAGPHLLHPFTARLRECGVPVIGIGGMVRWSNSGADVGAPRWMGADASGAGSSRGLLDRRTL